MSNDAHATPPHRRVPRALHDAAAPRSRSHRRLVRPRYALLINPFYPKDPHASFGKHVLTPTLALTSIAGATPPDWTRALLGREPAAGPAAVASRSRRSSASPCT